jgi:hypothetical protein
MLLHPRSMFAGNVHQQTIIADQPVLVLDRGAVLNSFARVEEATDFLLRNKNDTAFILRHNGLNWDIVPRTAVVFPDR